MTNFGCHYTKIFKMKIDLLRKVFQTFVKDAFDIHLGFTYLTEIEKGLEKQ